MLQVREIAKSFDSMKAVDGVDLAIERGTITGVIGPNGAGKSTLFALIAGARLFKLLDYIVNRGRRVKTGTIRWFIPLYVVAGLRRFRRGTLRHSKEVAHRNAWLANAKSAAPKNYALAVEILAARRLVKGYSDTYTRGQSKFDKVMAGIAKLDGRADAADWARRLREAALKDEDGIALSGALKTIDSFVETGKSPRFS